MNPPSGSGSSLIFSAEPFPQKDARFARGVWIAIQAENELSAI